MPTSGGAPNISSQGLSTWTRTAQLQDRTALCSRQTGIAGIYTTEGSKQRQGLR